MPYIHNNDSIRVTITPTQFDPNTMEEIPSLKVCWIDYINYDANLHLPVVSCVATYCQSTFCSANYLTMC